MKTPILVAALSATALFAQTPSQALEGRVEVFGEFSRPRQVVFGVANTTPPVEVRDQAESQHNGGGIHLYGELPGTQGWYFMLGGRLRSSSKLGFNGLVSGVTTLDTTDVSIRYSYWVVGISRMYDLGGGMTLGVHGEGRGEALSAVGDVYSNGIQVQPTVSAATTYFRPWVRASFDWTIPMSGMSPYIGLAAGVPLVKTSQNGSVAPTQMTSNTLKAMAPAFSVSLYAGLRF